MSVRADETFLKTLRLPYPLYFLQRQQLYHSALYFHQPRLASFPQLNGGNYVENVAEDGEVRDFQASISPLAAAACRTCPNMLYMS